MAISEEQLIKKLDEWDLNFDGVLPPTIIRILTTYAQFAKKTDIDLILRAYYFARDAHEGMKRKSGDDYITHPVEVAWILTQLRLDPPSVAAAFLHDTVEDTEATLPDIEREFGKVVANLVDGVTILGRVEFPQLEDLLAHTHKRLLHALADDIRVALVKFADRLHNMRTLEFLEPQNQISVARETLDFYAPLAHRFGMHQIKWELEDLSLKFLDKVAYDDLNHKLDMSQEDREKYLEEVILALGLLLSKAGIKARVEGRVKHIYSIHKKMTDQKLDFDELYDLIAVRVITDKESNCYNTLRIFHKVYKHISGKLKDYIGQPKDNGYESIHTTVFGPKKEPVEIQIRTEKMHRKCEYGIAAHWRYKEKRGINTELDEQRKRLHELLDIPDDPNNASAFDNDMESDFLADTVLVFTPKGDVISLPIEATPVDFAYKIHTDIGHHCHGARVNGRMVPLNTPLENGQIVEILTSKRKKGPSPDWLGFVRSSAAQRIRQWFRKESEDEQIALGKALLAKEERQMGLANVWLTSRENLERELPYFEYKTLDGFYAATGRGDLDPKKVLNSVRTRVKSKLKREKAVSITEEVDTNPMVEGDADKLGVLVEGLDDVRVRFAQCCRPIHGDKVVGFITKGRGITLHRETCSQLNSTLLDEARKVSINWSSNPGITYAAYIQVWALDRVGVLRDITTITTYAGASVVGIQMHFAKNKTVKLHITVKVTTIAELKRIINLIRSVEDVLEAKRIFT